MSSNGQGNGQIKSVENNGNLIELVNVYKYFDDDYAVLNNISMYIRKNEFLTLLGPSGCGKTTTLRIIGGFDFPTSGDLLFDGKSILNVPPYKRQVNTVFQKYALFPHMNIEENIAFGLRIKKVSPPEIKKKVENMLRLVNLKGYEKREISSLSGGQQQRIAIARALVNEPEVLLLDEPLGALDLKLRKEMQIELKNMQRELGITFIYVTHDQEEALTMSDTIAVMNGGVIQQIGTPIDIYNEPKNAFVAGFIGESNIIPGIMSDDFIIEFLGEKVRCADKDFNHGEPIDIVIRPEDVDIVKAGEGTFSGIVKSVIFKGVHYEMQIYANDYLWTAHSTEMSPQGSAVGIALEPNAMHVMKKSTQIKITPQDEEGDRR